MKFPKGAPLKTTKTKVVNPINKRNAIVAGGAAVTAGIAAGLAGRKNKTTTGGGTDAEGKKIPSTAEIRRQNPDVQSGTRVNETGQKSDKPSEGDFKKDFPNKKPQTEVDKIAATPRSEIKKTGRTAMIKKNIDRFGKDRVQMLQDKNKDFQAMKKGQMSKDDFIKKYPKSITAQRAKGLRDQTEWDAYDLVLEYLHSTGQVATIEEANYVMTEMDAKTIQGIVEEQKKNLNEVRLSTAFKVAAPFVGLGALGQLAKKDPVGNSRTNYQHNYNLKKLSGTGDSPQARDMLNIPRDYQLTPEEKKKYGFK